MNRRTATVLIDALFALVLVLVLLPHEPEALEAATPPGQLIIEIGWPADIDADVDLWVQAPTDRPVGYSAKSGRVFNLLRDDLGHVGDLSMSNVEIAVSRGLPNGEYQANVHLYSDRDSARPILVEVRALLGEHATSIWRREVTLDRVGQEITVMRFTITDGALERTSLHDMPRLLRANSL